MPDNLTIDWIQGCDLTSGPQDGSGNGLDFTVEPIDGGGVIYSANGAQWDGVGSGVSLVHALTGALVINDQDFFYAVQMDMDVNASGPNATYDDFSGSRLGGGILSPPAQVLTDLAQAGSGYVDILQTPPAYSTRFQFFLWYDHNTDTLYQSIDNAAASSMPLVGGLLPPDISSRMVLSLTLNEFIRYHELWIGAGALVTAQVANRSWLYNSGSGRTSAEILETAPTGITGDIVGQGGTSANRSFVDA